MLEESYWLLFTKTTLFIITDSPRYSPPEELDGLWMGRKKGSMTGTVRDIKFDLRGGKETPPVGGTLVLRMIHRKCSVPLHVVKLLRVKPLGGNRVNPTL